MVQSSIAWVDFAEADRRRMIEVVALFKQRDTRDELGLGSIRDTFADLFFPGTSTLQTRARYCLFVPWLYRYYEERRVASRRVAGRLRGDEVRLIRALEAAGEAEGIIGVRSGADLQRFPSSIYWNCLRRWQISRYAGSQGQYHRWLDRFYQRQSERQHTDDGEPVEGWRGGNWDPAAPPAPQDLLERASFQLTHEEADYLRERVMLSCPKSLLSTIVDRCAPVDASVGFVWLHPQRALFPAEQRSWMRHAQNFSEAMLGAVLLYNLMLAEQSGRNDPVDGYRQEIATWRAALEARGNELLAWDRGAFWGLVCSARHIPLQTRRFVGAWLDVLLGTGRIADPAGHQGARDLVRRREVWLKRGRSRFESQRHLEMWSGAAGVAQLDFRWSIARRLTDDILHGLGAGEEYSSAVS